jgi:hypothetical protein
MLNIDTDKVCYIIVKAVEFDVKVDPVIVDSGSNPADDMEMTILEDRASDPTAQELRVAIDDLNEDEGYELVALMWVGRGTYSREEWPQALKSARQEAVHSTSDYLMGTPLLADYLREGLAAFGKSCDETELSHL